MSTKLGEPLWKTLQRFSKGQKGLPYDPEILLLGVHTKKWKSLIRKAIYTHMFVVLLFTVAKIYWLILNITQP